MPSIEKYLCVGGVEISNPLRTMSYMANVGNSCLPTVPWVGSCCPCPEWLPTQPGLGLVLPPGNTLVADGPPVDDLPALTWTTPEADDAPWYDPSVPESADFLGVMIEEMTLGVPWSREARSRRTGAALGPGRLGGRELNAVGWVYTRSAAATWYARQWLFEALAGPAGCDGCSLPDALIWTHCDPASPRAGRRTLRRVGLTGFNPEVEPDFPRSCGFKFEATLTAEVGALFLDPVNVLATDLLVGDPVCNICTPCPTPPDSCSCGDRLPAPRVTTALDLSASYCEPVEVYRTQGLIDAPTYWRDATAVIRVKADDQGLANTRIRGWVNPVGLTDLSLFECQDPCLEIEVGCVPPGGELVIDGTTREATLVCEMVSRNGYAQLSSGGRRFAWPDVSCHGLLVAVDSDAYNTGPGSSVSIDLVERERG